MLWGMVVVARERAVLAEQLLGGSVASDDDTLSGLAAGDGVSR